MDTLSPGYYTIDGLAISGISNSAWGNLMVMQRSDGDRQQTFCSNGSGDQTIFYRVKNNNTWQTWKRVALASDFKEREIVKINKTIPIIPQGGYVDLSFNLSESLKNITAALVMPTSHSKIIATLIDKNVSSLTFAIYNIDSKNITNITIDGIAIGQGK